MSKPKEIEILYQGLDWHIGVDGCYINTKEKEPILNHLYEVALACKSKSDQLTAKEQECEELKKYLNQIRDEELSHLDIEWDEYETSARQEDYSNIITLVERALGEIDD